jgi:hypothetical protein
MLEGRTSDCLAIANTAILMRLMEELITKGAITRPVANTVLCDAVDSLKNCPSGDPAISWKPSPSSARSRFQELWEWPSQSAPRNREVERRSCATPMDNEAAAR